MVAERREDWWERCHGLLGQEIVPTSDPEHLNLGLPRLSISSQVTLHSESDTALLPSGKNGMVKAWSLAFSIDWHVSQLPLVLLELVLLCCIFPAEL